MRSSPDQRSCVDSASVFLTRYRNAGPSSESGRCPVCSKIAGSYELRRSISSTLSHFCTLLGTCKKLYIRTNPSYERRKTDLQGNSAELKLWLDQMSVRRWIENAFRVRQHLSPNMFRSAIDDKNLAGDKAGSIAKEKDRRIGNISRLSLAAGGNWPRIFAALGCESIHTLGAPNRTRCDDI